jgi:methanethiol S-methyltransferase
VIELKSILKVTIASVLFGVIHSALASLAAKRLALRLFGERGAGFYRLFYGLQSLALLNVYNFYVFHLPDRQLYKLRGALAWLVRAGWLANGVFIGVCFLHAGVARMMGLEDIMALVSGQTLLHGVDAQGPNPDSSGKLRITGPYRWSRHPINFAGLPALWLRSSMSVNRLVSCILLTTYLILGSVREEARLRAIYGPDYEEYRQSGVPFLIPLPRRLKAWKCTPKTS